RGTNVVQTQNFLDWRARNRSFERMAAIFPIAMNLEDGNSALQTQGMSVTSGFFEAMGVKPLMGRAIEGADDAPSGSPCVTVLSYPLWQRRFGGNARVLGRQMTISGTPCAIVGVMPRGFTLPTDPRVELYTALRINPARAPADGRNFKVVARLRPGVSFEQADAEMRAIAAQTAVERPRMNTNWSATVVPLDEQTVGETRPALEALLGAAIFVLLIACANVSNLLLMQAARRRREMTVRMALGAGRWRLFHQMMMESVLLALAGGAAGYLLAFWGIPAILALLPANFPLPRRDEISMDTSILAFTAAVSFACGLLFGLLSARHASRDSLGAGLRAGGRGGTAGNRGLRNMLVVAEVTLAMLLVIGAGLLLRSFAALNAIDPGFRPDRVIAFRMILFGPAASYEQTLERRAAVSAEILERTRALPGVVSASSVHVPPMEGQLSGTGYSRADRPEPPLGAHAGGDVAVISSDYFRTMGIRMLAGREFDARDGAGRPNVAILNQAAARAMFGSENPLGKHLRIAWGSKFGNTEIVGISADVRHRDLAGEPESCVYLSQAQTPNAYFSLVVRTSLAPEDIAPAVRAQIHAASPSQGVQDVRTLREMVSDSIARPRLDAAIMAIFGAIALTLACLGIYAVISYSVEQRRREMGVRLALGAPPANLLAMVLGEGLVLAAAGIGAGVLAALALTRYLASLLYGVKPADPVVFASVAGILATSALAGCYFPARRATRVDPMVVLREE
ncbi:MAG TPA: ABC transporter permease, partial [Bryobacteraceae bacterium]|nr:ABC transporter permease [Bryobacteraceae bacterium]